MIHCIGYQHRISFLIPKRKRTNQKLLPQPFAVREAKMKNWFKILKIQNKSHILQGEKVRARLMKQWPASRMMTVKMRYCIVCKLSFKDHTLVHQIHFVSKACKRRCASNNFQATEYERTPFKAYQTMPVCVFEKFKILDITVYIVGFLQTLCHIVSNNTYENNTKGGL